jgi:hypothetical protein
MPPSEALRFPYRSELAMPVIGLESEFKVFADGVEVVPEEYWRTPQAFITEPTLKRTSKSLQLPTGGALYFDGGVLEVVTPVIELAPQCTARVVRSLWEQIGFVRDQLDAWERKSGATVRLQAFSCHVNISFELPRDERNRNRTIQKLAVLLAHILPVPAIVTGGNRRSTGIGVRPRRDRIEITLDFVPDPGLMAASVALIVGIVRDVVAWPSYVIADAGQRGIPILADVAPGRHPSRKGWITRDFHFPKNPYRSDVNAREWKTRDGRTMSLREIALATALQFRDSIDELADPFSVRLLFAVLRGEMPSLLDLDDRPPAYDDVGRTTRWGSALPELRNFEPLMHAEEGASTPHRRQDDVEEKLAPPWRGEETERRDRARKSPERRSQRPAPSRRLTRSAYERVFLNLGARKRLLVDGEALTPVAVKGWYHSVFRAPNGDERLISIDQLLDHLGEFEE